MRAEQSEADPDGQFVFLWLAFNVAYATEIDPGLCGSWPLRANCRYCTSCMKSRFRRRLS